MNHSFINMFSARNISSGYGKKQVLFDVSFEVGKSEIILLVGSNGSGKSTLLKSIFGLSQLWNNGQIFLDGENITGQPTATLLKKGLLYVPQKHNLFDDLTVKENLEIAGLTLERALLKQRIDYTLSVFTTLQAQLNKTPTKLSGGERQLLSLAMVSLHQPKVLLIDEPFNGLSTQSLTLVIENLKLLNKSSKTALVIVEHRIKECLAITDRVIGLKLGKIISKIKVDDRFQIQSLNSIFI